ncbi:hypothetical protein RchiOBHm_Chr7g0204261 [Rosa chinensis]|uniref:Uncharacterized protein n=1 Tax=Rosa chinensis TaxID=74649 RepID=A0A2P6P8L7_ROSCH|nr:hypothetical protein RchiOBHm_Chr7g0204261 [Rosa chinensis]
MGFFPHCSLLAFKGSSRALGLGFGLIVIDPKPVVTCWKRGVGGWVRGGLLEASFSDADMGLLLVLRAGGLDGIRGPVSSLLVWRGAVRCGASLDGGPFGGFGGGGQIGGRSWSADWVANFGCYADGESKCDGVRFGTVNVCVGVEMDTLAEI